MYSERIWHLMGRKLAGEATLDEIRELEQLLAGQPDIASRAEIHAGYFNKKPHSGEERSEEENKAWQRQLTLMQQRFPEDFTTVQRAAKPLHGQKRVLLYLATVVVLGTAVLLSRPLWHLQKPIAVAAQDNGDIVELKTAAGDKIKTILPDGSIVWLNTESHINYNKNFGVYNRDITLTGEAFFDVVHKAEMPMVVHAGPVDVRVKGTAFNVKSYPGDDKVEASLIRGSIELTIAGASLKKIWLQPNQKVTVHITGEAAAPKTVRTSLTPASSFTRDTLSIESSSGLIPEIAWIENKLVFNNEPLAELAGKLERWYHVTIKINDAGLANERFTGVFETETLKEALEALRLTYRFHYKIQKDLVTITKK